MSNPTFQSPRRVQRPARVGGSGPVAPLIAAADTPTPEPALLVLDTNTVTDEGLDADAPSDGTHNEPAESIRPVIDEQLHIDNTDNLDAAAKLDAAAQLAAETVRNTDDPAPDSPGTEAAPRKRRSRTKKPATPAQHGTRALVVIKNGHTLHVDNDVVVINLDAAAAEDDAHVVLDRLGDLRDVTDSAAKTDTVQALMAILVEKQLHTPQP